MSIGSKIKRLRHNKRWSQEELAHQLNVAQTSISNFESDKTIPDFMVMNKICELFEVGFDYFVEEKNIYNVDRNIGGVVGCNKGTINNIPEGILENMLKRLEILETKTKNL